MKPKIFQPSQGKILISEPFLSDFYFRRSVVLLADHTEQGSFGLILNKPLNIKFKDIIQDFPAFKSKIYLGGPVQTNSLFMLHTIGKTIEGSIEIMKGLYWGGNFDQMKDLIVLKKAKPSQVRFFIGYTGWEPKQLDQEIDKKSWVISTAKLKDILDKNVENLWGKSLQSLGKEYAEWINYPIDPILN